MEKEQNLDFEDEEDSLWDKGSFVQSISQEELEKKRLTINKSHNEDMNFNCKKCKKKISAHNNDWHDCMCDDCFNKTYFPDLEPKEN